MLKEVVKYKMIEALKSGNKTDKQIYSMILQALQKAEKEKMSDLTEQEEITVITKYVKQVNDSIVKCPPNRTEILDELNHELETAKEFIPKQLDENEIKEIIESVLAELNITDTCNSKDKGKIMKVLMPKVKGKADGALVNKLLSEYFH